MGNRNIFTSITRGIITFPPFTPLEAIFGLFVFGMLVRSNHFEPEQTNCRFKHFTVQYIHKETIRDDNGTLELELELLKLVVTFEGSLILK